MHFVGALSFEVLTAEQLMNNQANSAVLNARVVKQVAI